LEPFRPQASGLVTRRAGKSEEEVLKVWWNQPESLLRRSPMREEEE
jgi:hypothetical protein